MKLMIAAAAGLVCVLGVAGCDNTYTPGAHHDEAASTGSMLSGTDTGVNKNGNSDNPAITSNLGVGVGAGGGR